MEFKIHFLEKYLIFLENNDRIIEKGGVKYEK
jgi:hypothetical protein